MQVKVANAVAGELFTVMSFENGNSIDLKLLNSSNVSHNNCTFDCEERSWKREGEGRGNGRGRGGEREGGKPYTST